MYYLEIATYLTDLGTNIWTHFATYEKMEHATDVRKILERGSVRPAQMRIIKAYEPVKTTWRYVAEVENYCDSGGKSHWRYLAHSDDFESLHQKALETAESDPMVRYRILAIPLDQYHRYSISRDVYYEVIWIHRQPSVES